MKRATTAGKSGPLRTSRESVNESAGRLHSPEMYGIYRLKNNVHRDNPLCWVWNVRIQRDRKLVCNRSFSDIKCGGSEEALRQAKAFRDEVLRTYAPVSRRVQNQRVRRNNTTGISGVTSTSDRGRACYQAETMVADGQRVSGRFYVDAHGRDAALQKAIAERLKQLEGVTGWVAFSPGVQMERADG